MSDSSVVHATFVIERKFPQAPERVFNAFADPLAKARWFSGPPDQWTQSLREFDFRVGGRERLIGAWAGGKVSSFDSVYQDIVPNERIIYSYAMQIDGVPISVSLATVEFKPAGNRNAPRYHRAWRLPRRLRRRRESRAWNRHAVGTPRLIAGERARNRVSAEKDEGHGLCRWIRRPRAEERA